LPGSGQSARFGLQTTSLEASFNDRLYGAAWTADGASIIFSVSSLSGGRDTGLWRVQAAGGGQPELLPFGAGDGLNPAVSSAGNRLVYARSREDQNLWHITLPAPGISGGMLEKFLSSTRADFNPSYSPDGTRVAFASNRAGNAGLWIGNADGSDAAERAGGEPTLLVGGTSDEVIPSWSADGRAVYFGSNRTGRYEIWKTPAGGGPATQVTTNGGHIARESLDGQMLFFTRTEELTTSLWRMPVSGNANDEEQVLPAVTGREFAPTRSGIYFVEPPRDDGVGAIQFLSFESGTAKTVADVTVAFGIGLAVSPDERALIYIQRDNTEQGVMLVEGFR